MARKRITSAIIVHCAHDELRDPKTLKGNPRNPNKHPASQITLLAKVIGEHGWRLPITISRRSGYIVRGHGRLEAALKLRVAVVPVDYQDYASDAEEYADLVVDNRLPELAELDRVVMKDLFSEMKDDSYDLSLTGFTDAEVSQILDLSDGRELQEDETPEPPKNPVTKPGDIWVMERHRLLCGDSTVEGDVKRVMDGSRATCVFTDPPYGVSIARKNRLLNTVQPSGRCLVDIEADALPPKELKEELLRAFVVLRTVVMDEDCSVFVSSPQGCGLSMMMMMMMMMQEAGLRARHVLIWKKNQPTFSMGRLDYDYQHEPILFTWLKRHKRPMLGKFKTSIWEIDKPRASPDHPTMKPVELYSNAYLNNSDEGDNVADIYAGSGPAFSAAEQLNRRCYGIEISPAYCDVIVERWENLSGKKAKRIRP